MAVDSHHPFHLRDVFGLRYVLGVMREQLDVVLDLGLRGTLAGAIQAEEVGNIELVLIKIDFRLVAGGFAAD
ncbi:MAG: hypothetical protein U1F68_01385 [Gammaproteobacteria bacterium]